MQKSLTGRIQDAYVQYMAKLGTIHATVSTNLEQGKQLFTLTTNILQTNIRIFQAIVQIQNVVTAIPEQIERQQPVFLVDALGRWSPFHLEFIRSSEALKAVLIENFRKFGASSKIEKNEFVLEDAACKRDINLDMEWEKVFYPGQHVNMSIVFKNYSVSDAMSCPGCGRTVESLENETKW